MAGATRRSLSGPVAVKRCCQINIIMSVVRCKMPTWP
jgi:hypothetical protein